MSDDADGRPPRRRRRRGCRLPTNREAVRGRSRPRAVTRTHELPRVWYLVRDFDRGRDFYKRLLGFDETFVDWDDKWSKLEHGAMRIALAEGEPTMGGGVAAVDVDDIKSAAAAAARRRRRGRHGARARRPDAARRRLRPGRQPRAAHRGDRVIRKGSAGRRPVHALDARARLRVARERVRGGHPALALRRQLGATRRPGRDRARDGQPRRRCVAARVPRSPSRATGSSTRTRPSCRSRSSRRGAATASGRS